MYTFYCIIGLVIFGIFSLGFIFGCWATLRSMNQDGLPIYLNRETNKWSVYKEET